MNFVCVAFSWIITLPRKHYLSLPLHNTKLVVELLCLVCTVYLSVQQNRAVMRTVGNDYESLTGILS
jgi:hypothetical protein